MTQLGGHAIYLTDAEIGLGKREPVKDVARVMSGMCDGIMTRTFSHALVVELATFASVPVINGLSDNSHPCQAMADLVTIKEKLGGLEGLKLVFIGDGNNVARSLAVACGRFEIEFVLAGPAGRQLDDDFVYRLRQSEPGVRFMQTDEPRKAVEGADIVYTDTWISMGQENDRDERIREFQDYQVTTELLKSAKGSAIIMHDLPAYRGYEITDEVIECEQSVVFDQAENRLHFQRALMAVLMGGSQRK